MTYMSSPSCQVARISNKRWRKQVSFSEDPVTEIPEDILETYQAEYYDSCVTGFVYCNRQVRAARTLQSIEETKAVELSRIQQEKEEQMAAALAEFQNEILDQEQDEPPPVIITDRVEEVVSSCEEISSLLDQFFGRTGKSSGLAYERDESAGEGYGIGCPTKQEIGELHGSCLPVSS
ncbi:expressed unknown protein [Seminavis robusta]|uniref:Uncharacterized protein n=1 Tax=Seminavis robusta TaxID=568900 RepID=A0A9N8DNV4_9STRA|nr:expressed unknown protein [Seminavis robusta]|eukprot:Sro183_g079560.1 n/a (178) ;mRNA; f:11863-12483